MDHDNGNSRSPVRSRKRKASASAESERASKRTHFSPPRFSEWPRGRSRVRQVSREARLRQQRAQELLRNQGAPESLLPQKAEMQLGNQSAAEQPTLRKQGPTSTGARKRARDSSEDRDEDEDVAGARPPLKKQRAVSDEVPAVSDGFSGWTGSSSGLRPRGLERLPPVTESDSDDDDAGLLSKRLGAVDKEVEDGAQGGAEGSEESENEEEEEEVESEGSEERGETSSESSSGEVGDLPDYDDEGQENLTYADFLRAQRENRALSPLASPSAEDSPGSLSTGDPVKKRSSFPSSLAGTLSGLTPPVSFAQGETSSPTSTAATQRATQNLVNPTRAHTTATQPAAAHLTGARTNDTSEQSKPATVVSSKFEQAYSRIPQQQTSENAAPKSQSDSRGVAQASDITNATNHLEDQRPSAPEPLDFTAEEISEMMARHEGNGPDAEDFEILRLVLEELEDRMDVDSDEDADTFNSKQREVRERLRGQRDAELREVKEFERLRESVSGRRKRLDEASSAQPPSTHTTSDQDDYLLLDEILSDPTKDLESEKLRLSEAELHWKSAWPNPTSFTPQHWLDEAVRFSTSEEDARDVHEKIYWSNLRIQASAYARRDVESGNSCRTQIRVALLDWKRNVGSTEATLAAAKKVGDLRVSSKAQGKAGAAPVDPRVAREAPLREKLGRLLTQLPPELDQKVSKILDVSTNQVITKTVESVNITRRDIAKILHSANFPSPPSDPPGWLNDEIINAFFAALTKALNDKSGYVKSPNNVPPYVTYNSSWLKSVVEKGNDITAIQRWSRRKGITGDRALKCKRIFFPVNPGNHWTLLVISPDARAIEYLDSLDTGTSTTARKATRYINLARAWLQMELGDEYVPDEWTELDRRSPIQDNGSDCGMFACLNGVVSALEFESPTDIFGPSQIPYARRALISMLDVGGFQDYFEL